MDFMVNNKQIKNKINKMQRRVVIRNHIVGINNTYCCVPFCTSHATKNPEVSFHRFPVKDETRKKTWIRLLRIGKKVTPTMRVCSKHFRITDYYYPEVSSRCPRLIRGAVPSLNLPGHKDVKQVLEESVKLGPKVSTFRIPSSEFTKAARILASKKSNISENNQISEASCDDSKTSKTITDPLSVSSLKPGTVLLVFPKKLKSPEIVENKICEHSQSIKGVKRMVSKSGDHIPLKGKGFKFKDTQLAVLEHYYEKDPYPDSQTREEIVDKLNKAFKRSGGERVYLPVVNKWFKRQRSYDAKKLREHHGLSELNNNVTIEASKSSKDKNNDECDENLEEELNILEREKEKLKQTLLEKEKEEKHLSFIKKLIEVKFMVEQALEEFKAPQSYQEETVEDRIQALYSKISCLKS